MKQIKTFKTTYIYRNEWSIKAESLLGFCPQFYNIITNCATDIFILKIYLRNIPFWEKYV